MDTRGSGFARGFARILPICAGVAAFGIVFGALAVRKGLAVVDVALMSITVFAGTAQMMSLQLWAEPLPILALALTTLVINLRFAMMTASLQPWLAQLGPLRAYAILFFTADENWAVSIAEMRAGRADAWFFLGTGVALWLAWVASTVAGAIIGAFADFAPGRALEFVFVGVFLALLAPMWRGHRDLLPWAAAGLSAWLAFRALPGLWYLVIGGMAGSLVGAWSDARR
ncbi:MAG: AzlC family ABC transporter permease [Alphaproteobacteria bacterium]|nr:AzlC family ABC transporter permease [Alphaproteobacteria bacterium]